MDPAQVRAFSPDYSFYNRLAYGSKGEDAFLEQAKRLAFKITSELEGGKTGSLQTIDSGIISYGKHQATLSSGTLFKLLDLYTNISDSTAARGLSEYLDRVKSKDVALRGNQNFLTLLKEAASDSAMDYSQDKIFSENFWKPAVKKANEVGIQSSVGLAIFYDTHIQGGLESVINRTWEKFNTAPNEKEFLSKFLESRKERLVDVAASKRKQGLLTDAAMLESAAQHRIPQLERILRRHLP